MCTLTLAWRVFPDAPVVVAANRDESLDRPSEPPARRALRPTDEGGADPSSPEAADGAGTGTPAPLAGTDDRPLEGSADGVGDGDGADRARPSPQPTHAIAPRDAEAGGTWIGANDPGVFVGVTNRWVEGLAGERSRGLLVADCLRAPTAEAAARHVERAVRRAEYDGFNLVVADDDAAILLEWDGRLRVRNFDPGVHVVVNVGADGDFVAPPDRPDAGPQQADNAVGVGEALAPDPGETVDEWVDRAKAVLGDHDYGVCVHGPPGESESVADDDEETGNGYGTRSSSILVLGDRRRYEYADGPPCETEFRLVAENW